MITGWLRSINERERTPMKKAISGLLVTLIVFSATSTHAIDRGARLIDTIGVESTLFDGSDAISGTLWGETIINNTAEEWAFLIGGKYGTVSPHLLDNVDFWSIGIGMKYYMLPVTSIAVTGHYGDYDIDGNPDVREGNVTLKQRLLPADAGISPFVTVGYSVRSADSFSVIKGEDRLYESTHTSSENVIQLGVGVDLSMTDAMAIVIKGLFSETETLEDGWITSIGMMYYWE